MSCGNISTVGQRIRYILTDLLTGNIAFLLFDLSRFDLLAGGEGSHGAISYLLSDKIVIEQISVPLVMIGIFWLSGYYNRPFGKSRLQELMTTFYSALINTSLIYLALLINDSTGDRYLNYELLLTLFGLLFGSCYLGRIAVTQSTLGKFRSHHWELGALVVGNSNLAHATVKRILGDSSRVSYKIYGFIRIPGESDADSPEGDIFELESIPELCVRYPVRHLILAPETMDDKKILMLLYHLFPYDLSIKIAPDTFSFVTSSIKLKDIYGEPFVDITSPSISEASKNIKRTFDVVTSLTVLSVFFPVLLFIAFMVKWSSPGKIIYSQERIGRKQRPFMIYKFRTMSDDAEQGIPLLSSPDDSRVTHVGRILRKYRLDELPQFWNVLKGDMSVVGPRPERRYFIDRILEKAPYYGLVCQVRPGITSWGMVKYGYASSVGEMLERTKYDLIYLSNMSLSLDLKILIYTIRTVVCGKGI